MFPVDADFKKCHGILEFLYHVWPSVTWLKVINEEQHPHTFIFIIL